MQPSLSQEPEADALGGAAEKPRAAPPRALSLLVRLVLCALAAFWLFGAVLFLRADGSIDDSLPRRELPPATEHNLASYRYGPRVAASSYYRNETDAHHHPMFVVDERKEPSLIEKWTSAERDPAPWLSVRWREPRALSRVVIHHAGVREAPELTSQNYRLRCLTQDGTGAELQVRDNHAAVAEHALTCAGAIGVRIEFERRVPEVVRVFEVEAWGR